MSAIFDLAADLARAQAAQVTELLPGQCDWCGAICGHEQYCSVYDDPLTNYGARKCPECKGSTLHAEDCPERERDVKFIERPKQ